MPKLSVIMGCYNSSKTIERAVKSILIQSFYDFELIICDDASTDNTLLILRKLAEEDRRIKILHNEENKKLSYCLNRCLDEAKGDFIARMDDDDISDKYRFEKQIDFLNNNPKYSWCGTRCYYFDDKKRWLSKYKSGEVSMKDIFTFKNGFIHPSVIIKYNVLKEVKGYTDEKKTRRCEDFDLWMKLYKKGYIGYNMEEPLIDYYESSTSLKKRKFIYRIDLFKVLLYWKKEFNLSILYYVYCFRPILVGILPNFVIKMKHNLYNENTRG